MSTPAATSQIGHTGACVLLAVIDLGNTGAGVTVRSIAAYLRLPATTAWKHLDVLRAAGLVTWTSHAHGTIRPAVEYASLTGGSP